MAPLRFGLVPTTDSARMRSLINALCGLLSAETGSPVESSIEESPAALASALSEGRVHVAWSSPTLLLMSEALSAVIPLLSSVRQSVAFFHAILFVREDSPITTIEELAGKHVAWVAKTSAAGYIVPRTSLVRQGLDPTKLFARESFLHAHGAVARAVLDGTADVGATFAVFEGGDPNKPMVNNGFRQEVTDRGVRVIDAAGPIPSDMIVATPAVPIRARASFANAMTKLATDSVGGPIIREVIGAEAFEPFSAVSFRELEELLRFGPWKGVAR